MKSFIDSKPRAGVLCWIALWLGLSTAGMVWLAKYKGTPGANGSAPPRWPIASRLMRAADRPTLLLFAHPQCNCTRATLAELDRLMARVSGRVATTVVLIVPPGERESFAQGELSERARRIPGVQTVIDADGREADRFGAQTSGDAMLYGRDGRLLFEGGLTLSRGHEGLAPGSERIAALVNGESAIATAPVFGCSLKDPAPGGGR